MASTFTPYAGLPDTIQAVAASGVTKTQLSLGQLFTLGFIAAAYLSFATTLSLVVGAGIETPGLQKLVMGVVFPIGLISLVIGGGEMWTGSSMNAPGAGMVPRAGHRRQILARVVSSRHLLCDGSGAQRGQHVPHPGRHHGGCPRHLGTVLLLQSNPGDAGQRGGRRHLPRPGLLVCCRDAGAQRDRWAWGWILLLPRFGVCPWGSRVSGAHRARHCQSGDRVGAPHAGPGLPAHVLAL